MTDFVVGIGAGHGYNTTGKRSPDGEREWSFNNKVVLAAINHLNKYEGVRVVRVDDPTGKTDVHLRTRRNTLLKAQANIYVSCHQNAYEGVYGNHGGTETFHYPGSVQGKKLASLAHANMVKAMGLTDRGLKTSTVLYDLGVPGIPAIITEGGFMDSRTDIKKLRSNAYLTAQGVAIAEAIVEYAKLKKKPVPVKKPTSKPSSKGTLHRVSVNGKAVGAYGMKENVLNAVERALESSAKNILIEQVK